MNIFMQIITNKCVYVPIAIWTIVQVMKIIIEYIKTRKINFRRLVGAGGMPSSHSAIVCALASCIGKEYGFDSGIFAIALIMAFVVMYDAAGVRRAAGKQAACLNKIIMDIYKQELKEAGGKLKELLGHTPMQVLVGAIFGVFYSYYMHILFKSLMNG